MQCYCSALHVILLSDSKVTIAQVLGAYSKRKSSLRGFTSGLTDLRILLATLPNLILWILCLSWGLWGRSWLHFETSWRDLGLILEPLGGVLAASWGLRYLGLGT